MSEPLFIRFSMTDQPMSSKLEVIDAEGNVLGMLPATSFSFELDAANQTLPIATVKLLAGHFRGDITIPAEKVRGIFWNPEGGENAE